MKLRLLAIVLCSIMTACGSQTSIEPEDYAHIPMDRMEQILMDLHMAEVYSSMLDDSTHTSRSKNIDSLAVFYKDVFAHHNITQDEFEQSFEWYRTHPAEIDTLYKRMIVTFSHMPGADSTMRQ